MVEASFWPNAFEPGETTEMILSGGGQDLSIPATASTHYALTSDEPLPPLNQERRALREATVITVRAPGLDHLLGVQVLPGLGRLQNDLAMCASLLAAGD